MTYLLALALPTIGALLWLLHQERQERIRLVEAHRAELAQLHQARTQEVADLLQRIQAPEQAVTSHVADTAGPDPAPVRLENDEEMLEAFEERRQQLEALSG